MEKPDYFSLLVGKRLTDMGRAADMIWVILEEYNIDIVAQTIIIKDGIKMIESDDIYLETGEIEPIHQRPISIYDIKVEELLASGPFIATKITADAENNLHIDFSQGLTIQTTSQVNYKNGQVCALLDDEKWRIFAGKTNLPHMVARMDGIYCD